MSENSKIEWTDHTFNPWEGCQKVGPGCDHCYAETRNARFAGGTAINWGPSAPRRRTSAANWQQPLRWDKNHEAFFAQHGRRQRVFCASLADVFDNAVDPQWRVDLLSLIDKTPNLDWLLLTKRIGNANAMLDKAEMGVCGKWTNYGPRQNVWIGISVVNQEEADRDIPKLLAVPAAKRFLSMEPLLGPVNLRHLNEDREINEVDCLKPYSWDEEVEQWRDSDDGWKEQFEDHYAQHPDDLTGPMHAGIDWVIVGGESGPGARPMHPAWVRSLRGQCRAAGVPFFFKQWGEWQIASVENGHHDSDMARNTAHWVDQAGQMHKPSSIGLDNPIAMVKVGKKAAGRVLDDRELNEVPV